MNNYFSQGEIEDPVYDRMFSYHPLHTQHLLKTINEKSSYQRNQNIDLEQNIFSSNGIILESISNEEHHR